MACARIRMLGGSTQRKRRPHSQVLPWFPIRMFNTSLLSISHQYKVAEYTWSVALWPTHEFSGCERVRTEVTSPFQFPDPDFVRRWSIEICSTLPFILQELFDCIDLAGNLATDRQNNCFCPVIWTPHKQCRIDAIPEGYFLFPYRVNNSVNQLCL